MNKTFVFDYFKSPVGKLKLVASESGLAGVLWENDDDSRVRFSSLTEDPENTFINEAKKQLTEYFAGKRINFDIKLDMIGTDFQKNVWQQLTKISFGQTKSYKDIAVKLNNEKACRAVGAANGKNPISIIVPCHRVIGASGSLTGFAGGLDNKSWLLNFEQSKNYKLAPHVVD